MENLGNIIVGGIVALIVILAVWKIIKDRREEKCCGGSCSCGCSGCAPASSRENDEA